MRITVHLGYELPYFRAGANDHGILAPLRHEPPVQSRPPKEDECGRDDEIDEEIRLWGDADERGKVEEDRRQGHVHDLGGNEHSRQYRPEEGRLASHRDPR